MNINQKVQNIFFLILCAIGAVALGSDHPLRHESDISERTTGLFPGTPLFGRSTLHPTGTFDHRKSESINDRYDSGVSNATENENENDLTRPQSCWEKMFSILCCCKKNKRMDPKTRIFFIKKHIQGQESLESCSIEKK